MRRGFGILSLVLTIIVIAVVGAFAYQAGWSDGFSQHVPEGTTAVAPYQYYGYGPHVFGFGWIFGLLFFLFLAFIFFRVVAFGLKSERDSSAQAFIDVEGWRPMLPSRCFRSGSLRGLLQGCVRSRRQFRRAIRPR